MIDFWLYAALLIAVALAFVLLPQLRRPRGRAEANRGLMNVGLYRERLRELEMQHDAGTLDAAQLEAGRAEAARELLDDAQGAAHPAGAPLGRAVPLAAALSTPLLALALYLHWGSLEQLSQARQQGGRAAQSVEQITQRLKALLAMNPDSPEGWSLLGRAYMAQGRMTEAATAFERAVDLAGRSPELLGRWAQALYFEAGQQWTSRLQALTDEALAGNPQEAISLKLRGMAAFRARRYAEAIAYWERLAATLPERDPDRAPIAEDIARARELAKAQAAGGTPR